MKIAVIGSMNIDKVASVDHIPLKGETLLCKDYMETFGGKGANQAVAIARLGGDVTMFGCVGNDGDGNKMLEHMCEEGICMDYVQRVNHVPTGCAFINIGEGDNAIVVVSGANSYVTVEYLKCVSAPLASMDIILLQNEIPLATVEYVLTSYGDTSIDIVYNPAPFRQISHEALAKATYITPNESEANELFKGIHPPQVYNHVIVTKGSKGVMCTIDGKETSIPAIKCRPRDTTGAGDTFNGAFAYGLSREMALVQVLRFANAAAGISTEKKGAQEGMPKLEAVNERLLQE